jgi:HD-GYP domain-containing protein (c-di-GMP phosphodiesterase class II)
MQLPEEQVKGIHLASIVHDVGKIHIPSEILTRPGRLSDIEFNLIRKHPQAGHDILKGIQFPWPIAHIVLQHHERLDGSGYPQGLQGSSILLESRILAVADVVEAIASHRPYRAALGMDAAIAEISQFSGLKYDAQVVAACVSLFENGYSLVTPKEN